MIKRFNNFLNEDMGYETIFGKKVSHEEALQERIRDLITGIITEEQKISEKSFSEYDAVIESVKEFCDEHPEIYEKAGTFYREGKRLQWLAEEVYFQHFQK